MKDSIQPYMVIHDLNGVNIYKFDGLASDCNGRTIFESLEDAKEIAIKKLDAQVKAIRGTIKQIRSLDQSQIPKSNFLFNHYYN